MLVLLGLHIFLSMFNLCTFICNYNWCLWQQFVFPGHLWPFGVNFHILSLQNTTYNPQISCFCKFIGINWSNVLEYVILWRSSGWITLYFTFPFFNLTINQHALVHNGEVLEVGIIDYIYTSRWIKWHCWLYPADCKYFFFS